MFTEKLNTYLVKGIKENRRYVYKVIAQQDQIDFSLLTEEEQKEIGIYYEPVVEAINRAWSYLNALGYFTDPTNEGRVVENLLIQARVRSQELLSDRRFTLKDLEDAIDNARMLSHIANCEDGGHRILYSKTEEQIIQSLSQQSWKVEIEHTCNGIRKEGESCTLNNKCTYPNCGKIKILKLC
jgi:EAL domain-containing protein (putative c-di-GMP-specific phosphodiesterase class I)